MPAMTNHYSLPEFGLQAILEKANDGVIVTKAGSVSTDSCSNNGPEIIYVNPAMEGISGYASRELIGKTPRILQCEQTSAETRLVIKQHLTSKQSVTCSILNARKEGELYWVELTIFPIKNQLGEVTHFASLQRIINTAGKAEDKNEKIIEHNNQCLLTRQAFLTAVETEWNRAYRHHSTFSVLCIRTLKSDNDTTSDDDLFSSFGVVCRRLFRKEDTFGRIADNEFAVLMPETDLQLAKAVVNRLRDAIDASPQLKNLSIQTGISELNLLDQDAASVMDKARQYSP